MARSSAYGNIIGQLPNWVLGGEFGDISNLLNNREQEYEATRQAQTLNDLRDIALGDARRQQDMDERMRESGLFDDGKQPTIGEMYDMKRKLAMEYGGLDDVLNIDKELAQIKAAQEKQLREQLEQARKDQEWNWKIAEKGSPSRKKERAYWMTSPDGVENLIPESQVNQKAAERWTRSKGGGGDLEELVNRILQGGDLSSDAPKPGEKETEKQQKLVEDIKASSVGKISSGQVAPSDIKIRDPRTGAITTIRKGEVVP